MQSKDESSKEVSVVLPDPFADVVGPTIDPVVEKVITEMNKAATSDYIQLTASRVTPKFSAKLRNIIYTAGIWAGVVSVIAGPIATALSGDAANMVASIGGLALALTNLLSKLNLSKTAEDLAKE